MDLNRLHVHEIADLPDRTERGSARDGATIFDENGMIYLTDSSSHANALRKMHWPTLFGAGLEDFASHCRPFVFGHALLEKLNAPYKSLTAHAWIVLGTPRLLGLPLCALLAWADTRIAEIIGSRAIRGATLAPIPVLGIPGWRSGQS